MRVRYGMAKTTGERLRAWRKQKGYSLRDVALRMGVSASTWMRWEAGHTPELAKAPGIERVTGGLVTVTQIALEAVRRER